jgi:hypothetical protein
VSDQARRAGRPAHRRMDRCGWLVMALLALSSRPAGAAEVAVVVQQSHGSYHVHGAFTVDVPTEVAWSVLADYEHIGEFVKSVRESRWVTAADGSRVLRQDAIAGMFPFRRSIRVELALLEDPERRIAFRDVLGRDFRRYAGAWTLTTNPTGTSVAYDLEAEPRSNAPGFMGRSVMAHSAGDLLRQVRAEMLRRAGVRSVADRPASR